MQIGVKIQLMYFVFCYSFADICTECISQMVCISNHQHIHPSSAHVLSDDRRPFDECAQKYIHRDCKQVTQTNALERISVTLIPHAKYVYTDMHVVHVCSLITLAHASFLYTHTIKYSQSIRTATYNHACMLAWLCTCMNMCMWYDGNDARSFDRIVYGTNFEMVTQSN